MDRVGHWYRLKNVLIIDGENGFLIDPYDIDGCAKKVIEILKNEELRISMGKMEKNM